MGTDIVWYAFRVPPRQNLMELTVRCLRNRGFEAGIPTEERLRRRTRRDPERKPIPYAVAPGYVFAGWPSGGPFPWHAAFSLPLIRSVVSIAGAPAQLNADHAEAFLTPLKHGEAAYRRKLRTGREFSIGDAMKVTDGLFTGYEGKVKDVSEGDPVFIINMFGRELEVTISLDDCAPVRNREAA